MFYFHLMAEGKKKERKRKRKENFMGEEGFPEADPPCCLCSGLHLLDATTG
jgi:hypothetical protein